MRHKPTGAEARLWTLLRNRRFVDFKFRRQLPVGDYIVDFVCLERKVIVELDGPFHARRRQYDAERDAFLSAQGYCVYAFPIPMLQMISALCC